MKRIVSVILMLVMSFALFGNVASADITSIETTEQYELWTQSPYLTSGISNEEVRLYKAMDMNMLYMYELPKLGDKYYFAVAEGQIRNSGKNGSTNLSLLYYYLLLTTDDGFIIIDYCEPRSSYYWERGQLIADVSDITVVPASGSRVLYVITPNGKYTASSWDEYNDYAFITEDKRMSFETKDDYYSQGGFPIIHEGKMYWGNDSYFSSGSSKLYYTSDGYQAMLMTPMTFSAGSIKYGTSSRHVLSDVTAANGYSLFESYKSDVEEYKLYKIPQSDNMYFSLTYPYTYNKTYGTSYYYEQIDIYQYTNGYMEKVKTYQYETRRGSAANYTITEFGGIKTTYYDSLGYSTPVVDIGKTYIITNTGKVSKVSLNSTTYNIWYYALYNNRLVVIRNRNNGALISLTENGSTLYKQALNYVKIDNSERFSIEEDIYLDHVSGGNPGQKGYFYPTSTFVACSTFTTMSPQNIKDWCEGFEDNVFDDRRTVTGEWYYVGNYYELWYIVRNPDNTICAIGPTGHTVSSTDAADDLFFVAVGDSKFIVAIKDINSDFAKEYYRVAIATETADGNVEMKGTIGSKTLTPPEDTDTVPVQDVIDFGQDNLPIGYNIRDNVISSAKLDSNVREQINAIRLNDIVIVKNSETSSGVQNTGTTLEEYEEYDSAMGDTPIVIYTNGQNFCWYCQKVDNLNEGTYNRYYTIADKVIYVTFKIVEAPDNDGVTTVVF